MQGYGSSSPSAGSALFATAAALCVAIALALPALASAAEPQSTTLDPECTNAGRLGTDFLPDCRAWELVSPPDKNGGDVVPQSERTRAASDGSAIEFTSLVSFADSRGGTNGTEYISERTATPGSNGWTTHSVTPAQRPESFAGQVFGTDPNYEGDMSDDLSHGVYRAFRPLTDAPDVSGLLNLYARDDLRTSGPGSYRVINDPGSLLGTTFLPAKPVFVGASDDFSDIIFESRLNLTPDTGPFQPFAGGPKLYENRDGALRLAGRIPPPGQTECDDDGATECEAAPASEAGPGVSVNHPSPNMISDDGSRVFFQAPPEGGGHVYMRIDGTRTVQIDVSEKDAPDAPQPGAVPLTASADGNRLFFETAESLVNEDADIATDYYMYEVDAPPGHHLTLISKDAEPVTVDSADGLLGASENGSYVYFEMAGQLVAGAGSDPGLYLWHEGEVRFLGAFADGFNVSYNNIAFSDWIFIENMEKARVSADGTHLMFASTNDGGFVGHGGFTGFDHTPAAEAKGCGERCQEFYVYDATDDRLRCASCDPGGAQPMGPPLVNVKDDGLAANVAPTAHLNRAISSDGRWVFFSSPDPLVPGDTNGRYDAYEYDTVTEEVHLLSSGTSPANSYFLESSADGSDVFFVTGEALSGWDRDTSFDLYDARVDGGLPEPRPQTAQCNGESCRGASPSSPALPGFGSGQTGPGNPKRPKRCPKGRYPKKARGKVRCIKRHPHHSARRTHAHPRAGDPR